MVRCTWLHPWSTMYAFFFSKLLFNWYKGARSCRVTRNTILSKNKQNSWNFCAHCEFIMAEEGGESSICTICRSVNNNWDWLNIFQVPKCQKFCQILILQMINSTIDLLPPNPYVMYYIKMWGLKSFSIKHQQDIIKWHSRREQTRKTGKNHTI